MNADIEKEKKKDEFSLICGSNGLEKSSKRNPFIASWGKGVIDVVIFYFKDRSAL